MILAYYLLLAMSLLALNCVASSFALVVTVISLSLPLQKRVGVDN